MILMQKIITSLVLFFIFFSLVFSQDDYTQTIRGTIVDKHSKVPLLGATVILSGYDPVLGTITDESGIFRLEKVPVGRHEIQVSYMGYHSLSLSNLLLTSGKELVLNIELEEKVFTAEEVVIKFKRRKDQPINEIAFVSARSFTVEETNRFAGSLRDPSRMVANYAGVMTASDSRNDIIIRGNSPMGLLWRLDGIDIPNPNHFGALGTTGGPISILNNNLLTNSDFFTGAFPAEYGNALAGAFDLKMRSGNNERGEYTGQIGLNGFEFGAEGPFSGKSGASYLASYRYSTLEVFNALGIDILSGSSIPQYQDLSFKIDVPGTKLGRFSLFGIGGLSYIELHDSKKDSSDFSFGLAGTDTNFGSDMGVIGFSHLYFFDEKTRIKTHISISGSKSYTELDSLKFDSRGNFIENSQYPFYRSIFSEIKYSFSTHVRSKFNAKNNLSSGIIFDIFQVDYIDSVYYHEDGKFRTWTDAKGNLGLIQAYSQWYYKFSNFFSFYSGLHFQQFTLNNSLVIEPRLGLKWMFGKKRDQSFNIGFGVHSQLQPMMSYFYQTLDTVNNTYFKTNEKLDFSRSNHLVLGYDYSISPNLRLKVETYYQKLYQIPVRENWKEFSMLNAGDYFAIPVVDSLLNEGTGHNYGIEFTFEKFLSKGYYFLLTTSLFDSKYKSYDGIQRNTAFNGNYVLNALGGYEFKLGEYNVLTFDFKTVCAGGKRYVPIDLNESVLAGETKYDWDNAFKNKYDDYFRIDLRIGFKMNGKKFNQEWGINLQNVTNHKNIFQETFNPIINRIKTDYQQGFFPVMLYRIQF